MTYHLDIVEISREEFQRLTAGNNCRYPDRQNVYLDSPRNLILGWTHKGPYEHLYTSVPTACPAIFLIPDNERALIVKVLSDGSRATITTIGNNQALLRDGAYLKFIIRKQ